MKTPSTAIAIKHLYISPGHNFYGRHGKAAGEHGIVECDALRLIAGRGIEGDRFFDYKEEYKGQITFFSHEVYERLCEQLGIWDRPTSVFRRNVITRGIDLNEWIGQEFQIQGIRFAGCEESTPCYWMNRAFGEGAEEALRGFGGLRAKILTDGVLSKGGV